MVREAKADVYDGPHGPRPSYVGFKSKEYHWKPNIDYRKNPHLYKVGRGQQGVLICQPYKSELHIHWRFKTIEEATISSKKIYEMFLEYLDNQDFVGADMAKKYLHMGFTRARRYWNHSSGKKWKRVDEDLICNYSGLPSTKAYKNEWEILPYDRTEKRFYESSLIFKKYWKLARENKQYLKMKKEFMCR